MEQTLEDLARELVSAANDEYNSEAQELGTLRRFIEKIETALRREVQTVAPTINPPEPVVLTYRKLGYHPQTVTLVPCGLEYLAKEKQWALVGRSMGGNQKLQIPLEYLVGEGKPFHGMSNAQAEAMYVMLDEMSGLLKATARQLRHSPNSCNPDKEGSPSNSKLVSIEFGRLWAAYTELGNDYGVAVQEYRERKLSGPGYLHHPKSMPAQE